MKIQFSPTRFHRSHRNFACAASGLVVRSSAFTRENATNPKDRPAPGGTELRTRTVSRCFPYQRALTLIECTVYMAIFSVVLSLAFAAFYRVDTSTRALSRNAADIVRATQAGERWRDELRASKGVRLDEDSVLHVARAGGEARYAFWENTVWRQLDGATFWTPFLEGAKSSRMIADPRERVTAWRWEVELQSTQKVARVRPLFTFQAVAPAAVKQP